MRLHSFVSSMLFGSIAFAGIIPLQADPVLSERDLVDRQDGACTNGPNSRQCWSNGYSIATDFDAKLPPDGITVTVRHFTWFTFNNG